MTTCFDIHTSRTAAASAARLGAFAEAKRQWTGADGDMNQISLAVRWKR